MAVKRLSRRRSRRQQDRLGRNALLPSGSIADTARSTAHFTRPQSGIGEPLAQR
jgi:hypothetical protein